MRLGTELRNIRQGQGWSLRAAADKIRRVGWTGITPQYLGHIERGDTLRPALEKLAWLARAYGLRRQLLESWLPPEPPLAIKPRTELGQALLAELATRNLSVANFAKLLDETTKYLRELLRGDFKSLSAHRAPKFVKVLKWPPQKVFRFAQRIQNEACDTAIGQWALKRRIELGKTQKQIGLEAGGVHQRVISALERGRINLRRLAWAKHALWAAAYAVTTQEFRQRILGLSHVAVAERQPPKPTRALPRQLPPLAKPKPNVEKKVKLPETPLKKPQPTLETSPKPLPSPQQASPAVLPKYVIPRAAVRTGLPLSRETLHEWLEKRVALETTLHRQASGS